MEILQPSLPVIRDHQRQGGVPAVMPVAPTRHDQLPQKTPPRAQVIAYDAHRAAQLYQNHQYFQALTDNGSSHRARQAIAAYAKVERSDEKDYVKKVMGVDEYA